LLRLLLDDLPVLLGQLLQPGIDVIHIPLNRCGVKGFFFDRRGILP
jgi:hypothetical protein